MTANLSQDDSLMTKSFDGFFSISISGGFSQADNNYCELMGYSESELLKLNILDVQEEKSPEKRDEYIKQIIAQGGIKFEVHHRSKNQGIITIQISAFYSSKDQQIYCFVCNNAKFAKAEGALRLANIVIDSANDVVLITEAEPIDGKGPRIVYANNAFERETGYSPTEVIGKTPRILQGPKTDRATLDRIRAALESWQPIQVEILNYKKNGEEFWTELNIAPAANENGWFTHWISIQRNITARKLAEEADAKNRTALMLANMAISRANDGIVIVEDKSTPELKQLNVNYVNKAFENETGYSSDEVIGHSLRMLRGSKSDPQAFERINLAIKSKQAIREEVLNYRKNGEEFWSELDITPITNQLGEVTHWISIQRNIDKRKATDLALARAKEKSEKLSQLKTEFIANMSHEIRTPMNGIIGLSTLALNHPMSSEVKDYLTKIESSSNDLMRILNDILDFAKLESKGMEINLAPFSLRELMNDVYALFYPSIDQKNLNYRINLDESIPKNLIGDAHRIKQTLLHLVENAIKFTSDGDINIDVKLIEAQASSTRVLFTVSDSGPGFNPKDIQKLQTAFSQGDGSLTRRHQGLGLGLAISTQLLKLMDSHLEIKNNLIQGGNVSFELTFINQDKKPLMTSTSSIEERLSGKHILVAEDNRINQQVVKEFLKRSGATVDTADNGIEVLELLLKNSYDAVLMDVQMPEMDGLEATEQIREEVKYDSLPIIALSAGVSEEERDDCAEIGMNDFIAKPINPNQLIEILLRWI